MLHQLSQQISPKYSQGSEMPPETSEINAQRQVELHLHSSKMKKMTGKFLQNCGCRHHTIQHYQHLLETNMEQADREKEITIEHLADIDRSAELELTATITSSKQQKIGGNSFTAFDHKVMSRLGLSTNNAIIQKIYFLTLH